MVWIPAVVTSEFNNSVTEVTLSLPFQATFKPVLRMFNSVPVAQISEMSCELVTIGHYRLLMRGYNNIQNSECNRTTYQMDDYLQLAQLMKTLAHPARLAILDLLRDGEVCVCHLEAALHQRQAYISQQLALLRDAGLVEDRREGWRIYYHVTLPQVFEIIDAVGCLTGYDTPRHSRSCARGLCLPCL